VRRAGIDEQKLRERLREAPLPGADAAERRGRAVVMAAFDERAKQPQPRRTPLPRLAIALAAVTLLAALLLSPAGASVRHWIGDVFEPGVRNAEPALTRVPGGGRLAVTSPTGPWVVQPNGERRLLGHYREATWSPHGLYLAAVSGQTLTALQPDGTPRWSIDAPRRVTDPRWSPSGYRIAYRAGGELRVVHADGSAPTGLRAKSAPIAPSWSPSGLPQLAYVDARGRVTLAAANSGERLAAAPALERITGLEWSSDGQLLEVSPVAVRLRPVAFVKLHAGLRLGRPRPVSLPGSARVLGASISPDGSALAVLRQFGGVAQTRAEVDLVGLRSGRVRRLFRTPGRLGEIAWSPDSSRLLITWPQADQWLFVPVQGHARVQAVGDISRQFAPGTSRAAFPRVAGWCCPQD
jgi:WD40-like Beta Propeller Repeat